MFHIFQLGPEIRVKPLMKELNESSADFIIFSRGLGDLLPGTLETLETVIKENPDVEIINGANCDPEGLVSSNRQITHLGLLQQDTLGSLVVIKTSLLRLISTLFCRESENLPFEIALRANQANCIYLPEPIALTASCSSSEHLLALQQDQLNVCAEILQQEGSWFEVRELEKGRRQLVPQLPAHPLISVVIPTRGSNGFIAGENRTLIVDAISDLINKTNYTNLEIIVVADDETPQAVIDEICTLAEPVIKLVRWSEPFNFSKKMNLGASFATGEFLLLLNDDIEVINPDWLTEMLALAHWQNTGIVGAMLYFEDGSIQHAGHLYEGGGAGHLGFGEYPAPTGITTLFEFDRVVSGVTAACALVSKEIFDLVGGFTEYLPGNYNDVDLNQKIRKLGYEAVCSSRARLYHFESKSRDPKVFPEEIEFIKARWNSRMMFDIYK